MKKTIIAVIILTAFATACTKKVSMPSDPEVGVNGITTVTASVADYEGQTFVWSPDVRIGIYDSNGHSNERYTILSDYSGQTGDVELYGTGINGRLIAYLPYHPKGYACVGMGRQPVLATQTYGNSAAAHFKRNAVLVARADDDGRFAFSYDSGQTGLMHFVLRLNVDVNVQEVIIHSPTSPLAGNVALEPDVEPVVTGGSHSVTVTSINKPCSETSPLEIWAIVPIGEYSHLTIAVRTNLGVISSPVEGTLIVTSGSRRDIDAEGRTPSGDNEDFTIVIGDYN